MIESAKFSRDKFSQLKLKEKSKILNSNLKDNEKNFMNNYIIFNQLALKYID